MTPDNFPEESGKRYNAKGKRRGRLRYAAPLGFLVLLFSLIGVVAVIVSGIRWVGRLNDDTALKEELYTFLNPVMQFCPSPFTEDTVNEQDALLLAAVYRVTETERIRQLREKDNNCIYPVEETQWRMKIPQTTIEESFVFLFGSHTPLTNRTVGDVEYKVADASYYVPLSINTSGYTPVIGTVHRKDRTYTVQVSYVANTDIEVDEQGNNLPPTVGMGKYQQLYTVEKTDEDWRLVSVAAVE